MIFPSRFTLVFSSINMLFLLLLLDATLLICIAAFILQGADGVNIGQPTTPLAIAAGMGSYNSIRYLLDAGATANIADAVSFILHLTL